MDATLKVVPIFCPDIFPSSKLQMDATLEVVPIFIYHVVPEISDGRHSSLAIGDWRLAIEKPIINHQSSIVRVVPIF
jgi:hypothetical protein